MRLVIDGRRLTAGRTGVGRFLETVLQEWARTGPPLAETLVVLHDPSGIARVPIAEGLRAEVVGPGWPGLVWERWGLGRVLRPDDLLFAPTNLIPSCWTGRTVLVVFDTLQEARPGDFPWHVRWRFGGRYRRAARRADRVIAPSRATADDVVRFHGVPRERIQVIAPGLGPEFRPSPEDAAAARQALGLGHAPFFLFVGKRSRRRNVPAILQAFTRFREHHPGHRLVFVGPPERRTGPNSYHDSGILEFGHVAEPILRGLMSSALALLYPSEYEGFGLPVIEAMACGCPVITLRTGTLIEAGGVAAWYLDAATPEDLAEAMLRLAGDPEIRSAHISRGLDHAARFRSADLAEAVGAELLRVAARPLQNTRAGRSPRVPSVFTRRGVCRADPNRGRGRGTG